MPFNLADLYRDPDRIVVTAHRGFSGLYPENTLLAFAAAVDAGADILEFDLRGTHDGVPIVLHDATFDRTANQPGCPADYTLAEIQRFEASFWLGAHDTGSRQAVPVLPGTRIPTFEEVLNATPGTIGLNIQVYDTSQHMLVEICRLYHIYDLYNRGYLTLPNLDIAARVRIIDPHIELCVTERQGRMDLDALQRQIDFGCRFIQPLRRDVSSELCAAVRELGLCANMFFSNTDEDNRAYIEMGMQGILTDRPDILIGTLRSLGRRQEL